MLFPLDEVQELSSRLNNNLDTYTTRISQETNKYVLNNIYDTNLGFKIKIIEIIKFNNINEHKFLNELTQKQKDELIIYNEGLYELIKITKI